MQSKTRRSLIVDNSSRTQDGGLQLESVLPMSSVQSSQLPFSRKGMIFPATTGSTQLSRTRLPMRAFESQQSACEAVPLTCISSVLLVSTLGHNLQICLIKGKEAQGAASEESTQTNKQSCQQQLSPDGPI